MNAGKSFQGELQQLQDNAASNNILTAVKRSYLQLFSTLTFSDPEQARLALARAVYSRADVILLDDTLAAVDA